MSESLDIPKTTLHRVLDSLVREISDRFNETMLLSIYDAKTLRTAIRRFESAN